MACKKRGGTSMTDLLREALLKVESLRRVATETGVQRMAMARFRDGRQSLRLDKADILADYFGIECRR
ncbi:MAG: hypothetical protein GY851_06630, partial [bacterium]|nr:hypothetical protein [bacterium]